MGGGGGRKGGLHSLIGPAHVRGAEQDMVFRELCLKQCTVSLFA